MMITLSESMCVSKHIVGTLRLYTHSYTITMRLDFKLYYTTYIGAITTPNELCSIATPHSNTLSYLLAMILCF